MFSLLWKTISFVSSSFNSFLAILYLFNFTSPSYHFLPLSFLPPPLSFHKKSLENIILNLLLHENNQVYQSCCTSFISTMYLRSISSVSARKIQVSTHAYTHAHMLEFIIIYFYIYIFIYMLHC